MDQPKIKRELQLLMLLANNRYATIGDICERLEISERTFYRYVDTFRSAGFVVKKNDNNVYKLETNDNVSRELGELLYFSEEEAYTLKAAIDSIPTDNTFRQSLKKKLYAVYDYKLIADIAVDSHDHKVLDELNKAIARRRRVCLRKYHSAHSNTTTDRVVEPYEITSTSDQVWCYELASRSVKMFKVSRIEEVELLEDEWQFEAEHAVGYIDIFRIHSTQRFHIELRLSQRAASLLREEYPLSAQYMTEVAANRYLLTTEVCSFEGVGRFILGLYNDVEIIESAELKEFVKYRVRMMG